MVNSSFKFNFIFKHNIVQWEDAFRMIDCIVFIMVSILVW